MSRKRMIDPGVWTDDGFLSVSMAARVLWFGLISHADDEGRGTASIRSLRARIFPGDGVTDDDITAMKADIGKHMRCVFYEADGVEYYQLLRWHEHQKMRQTAPSTIPPCAEPLPNHCVTDDEALRPRKEGRKEEKEEKEVYSAKRHLYAPNVALTEPEHEKLVKEHGEDVVTLAIELLDAYKLEKGKHYKSDAGALRSWGIQAALERREKNRKSGAAPPKRKVRKCPACGYENVHTGSMCLKCREEL